MSRTPQSHTPKPRKRKSSTTWTFAIGRRPFRLSVKERADKAGTVYAYFRVNGRQAKCSLDISVRDATGALVEDLKQQVISKATAMQIALRNGKPPQDARGTRPRTQATPSLTLQAGIDLVFQVPGKVYQRLTPHVRDMKAHAARVTPALERLAPTWADLSPSHYVEAWKQVINDTTNLGAETKGLRSLELGIHAVVFAATRLAEKEIISFAPKKPPTGWKEQLRKDWAEAFTQGDSAALEPNRPRFSHDEIARLIAACSSPHVDPRVGLAFMLGLEARLGQVGRCMRSHLLEVQGEDGELKLRIPGKKKKLGTVVLLTPQEREVMQNALTTGYLSELERSRRSGRLKDFPLFPSGSLRDGKAWPRAGLQPMNDRVLYGKFVQMEAAAGVEHVEGRGWYGARRTAVDLVSIATEDEDTKNHITGHKDSATRGIYMDTEAPARLKSIRAVRQKARESAGGRRKSKDATRDR